MLLLQNTKYGNFIFLYFSTGEIRSSENSYFCQAARQLACVPSSQLCVKLASGGDPTYAFNIRFTGEEVHGTSKSGLKSSHVGDTGNSCENLLQVEPQFPPECGSLTLRSSTTFVVFVALQMEKKESSSN